RTHAGPPHRARRNGRVGRGHPLRFHEATRRIFDRRAASTRGRRPNGVAMDQIPLIDREREIAELEAALASALAGSGRVALLAGEPGIGKTRLARAFAAEAEARGV